MLIWFILFTLVLAISFVLAWQSMADFKERPLLSKIPYTLYLIHKTEYVTPEVLERLHQKIQTDNQMFSLERLFKGSRKALVVFGPKKVLGSFGSDLKLVEIEDYSQVKKGELAVWELGKKEGTIFPLLEDSWFSQSPSLKGEEEFWWQLIFQSKEGNLGDAIISFIRPKPQKTPEFFLFARAGVRAADPRRLKELQLLVNKWFAKINLLPLPQAYSSEEVLKFYQDRAFPLPVFGTELVGEKLSIKSTEIPGILGI